MPTAKEATSLVIALVVAGLMIAFLFPVVIGAISGDASTTATLEEGETLQLQPNLTATLNSSTATSAEYVLNASGTTKTVTESEGSGGTEFTVGDTTVFIDVTDATATNATATFEYDGTYGWGGAAASLWGILGLMMVLVAFIFFVMMATDQL